ncbi:MAG TPA: hypothetical protein VGL23_04560 [Chloroflexota bacterium]
MSEQRGEDEPAADTPAASPRARGPWGLARRAIAGYLLLLARHRFVGCLFGLIVLLALCGLTLMAARLVSPREEALAPLDEVEINDVGSLILAEEDGVEDYLAGMAEFDARRMWDAYADTVRSEMTARGRSVEELQRGLDQARRNGARIEGHRSFGSYPLRDGRRFVFYIVRRSGFPPDGGAEELYFIFTVDPSGRILNVT